MGCLYEECIVALATTCTCTYYIVLALAMRILDRRGSVCGAVDGGRMYMDGVTRGCIGVLLVL